MALSRMEIDWAFKDVCGIVVKADNETCHYFHAVALDFLDLLQQVTVVL